MNYTVPPPMPQNQNELTQENAFYHPGISNDHHLGHEETSKSIHDDNNSGFL